MKQQQIRRQASRSERERRRTRREVAIASPGPSDTAAIEAADSVLATIDAVLADGC